jgi:hypothetical protein
MLNQITGLRDYFKELNKQVKDGANLKHFAVTNFNIKHNVFVQYSNELHTHIVFNAEFDDQNDVYYQAEFTRDIASITYDEEKYIFELINEVKKCVETKESTENIKLITVEE